MEFNPEFTFSIDGGNEDADPWEFSEALKQARKHPGQSSLDDKIRAKVKQRVERKESKSLAVAAKKRKRAEVESESDDSEDEALPGELDDDDDDEDGDDEMAEEESGQSDGEEPSSDDEDQDDEDQDDDDDDDDDGDDPSDINSDDTTAGGDSDADEDEGIAADSDAEAASPRARGRAASEDDDDDDEGAAARRARAAQARVGGAASRGFFTEQPAGTQFSAKGFSELNLSRPLVKACTALGYERPTPIQAACIPLALLGRDIVGSAITGSGKTAAFALPLLERLLFRQKRIVATYVLILAPVRELAVQVHSMITKLALFTDIRAAIVVGGLSMAQQAAELRKGPEIVVATPGRIIDHILNTMSFELDSLSALVLDEADRLLDMGFMEEIKQIVKMAPKKRQTLLFSATMTDEVRQLIQLSLNQPVRLAADKRAAAPARLRQEVVRLKGAATNDKDAQLLALCARTLHGKRSIVFCTHKRRAHRLKILLGLLELQPAVELHGDMTQAARLEALDAFRRGDASILIATDVAARGLDITGVTTVINYDCPASVEVYLHRIGRTARAGAEGLAITFVEDGDRRLVKEVVKQVKVPLAARTVPESVVAAWRVKAERAYPQIEDIIEEERQERELRKAEMEASKAANMIEHEAEIYSRPKKEWFLTMKEKNALARAEKAQENSEAAAEKPGKGKAAKAARNALSKGEKTVARAPPQHVTETERHMGKVKAAKSAARKMRELGTKPKESARAALTSVTGISKSKEKPKKKKQKTTEADPDPTGYKAPRQTNVYEGGGRSGTPRKPHVGLSKAEKARFARGGKGKGQFKSKARHKRKR